MDFISSVFSNPLMTGAAASAFALLYFFVMTISPSLPPAIVFSAIIGYFVYAVRSGKIGDQTVQKIPTPPVKATVETETNDDHEQRKQQGQLSL